jgi:hypothetical protein
MVVAGTRRLTRKGNKEEEEKEEEVSATECVLRKILCPHSLQILVLGTGSCTCAIKPRKIWTALYRDMHLLMETAV